jgi:hypothetical protein
MIRPADIIVVAGTDTLSRLIMDCEARETGQPAHVSHMAAIIGVDPIVGPIAMQAIAQGVHTDPLALVLDDVSAAWCISDKFLTDTQRLFIVKAMMTFSCEQYAYPDLLLQLLDAEFHTDWWTEELGAAVLKHTTICSYWPIWSYRTNLPLGNDAWGATPSDSFTPENAYLAGLDANRYEMTKLI